MLRYYSYYSIGGYKDFYLGSDADKFEATYYIPLLPIWEKRAEEKNDTTLKQKTEQLRQLPSIKILDETNSYGMPSAGNILFSHGGYKLIYEHLEGEVYALSVRDIESCDKDETGRDTPFLFAITADTPDDTQKLNKLAAYAANNLATFSKAISSSIGYDVEKNGLRFDLAALNEHFNKIIAKQTSCDVTTAEKDITISAKKNSVQLLVIPDGIPEERVTKELNLTGKPTTSVYQSKILPLDLPKTLVKRLRSHYTALISESEQATAAKVKKDIFKALGIGILIGIIIAQLF